VKETIKNAYDEELIDPDIISLHNFKSALEEQGKKEFLEKYRIEQERTSMDDTHGRMSWWACFNREMDMPRIAVRLNQNENRRIPRRRKTRKRCGRLRKRRTADERGLYTVVPPKDFRRRKCFGVTFPYLILIQKWQSSTVCNLYILLYMPTAKNV
jgi:hypothetical protein